MAMLEKGGKKVEPPGRGNPYVIHPFSKLDEGMQDTLTTIARRPIPQGNTQVMK